MKDKIFVICLPGRMFSGNFMCSLIELIKYIESKGAKAVISQHYSAMVNHCRCIVAGADLKRGEYQEPFGGMKYDYMLWIDSDIRFTVRDFVELVVMDKDIASGWYAQPGAQDGNFATPVVKHMDDQYLIKNGHYQFLTVSDMTKMKDIAKVDYVGFGWVLIKRGVFEKLKYPWFAPRMIDVGGGLRDMCSEDVAFCIDARNTGFEIWLNPRTRVGHEKTLAI